ncbi:gluconate permease [Roseiconus nitratireducens]|uniref:Gluconate permease n=1 Tax=Roseiconus nitratireducens TaxID=2605748 RepID=A0A5M6DIA2_9BACT|nr:SLC13 family permease [Roseiconus nitratireducens]KAA5545942.1 gluconate permease [Roseiconus nitratireducens]
MNIWLIVGLSVCVVLVAILVFRLHAFLTLLLAGVLVAGMTDRSALDQYAQSKIEAGQWTARAAESFRTSSPVTRLTTEFGVTAGKIGILIALASVIGGCLSESGAAATIVHRMLRWTGPKRSPEALALSSFIIGIPVFFDTVFYLMVPLARSLRRVVGKDYVLFLLAILAGGSIAHSLIPPTPGPLQVAEILDVDVGVMLGVGLVIGGFSSVLSLGSARLINHFVDVPLRDLPYDASPSQNADDENAGNTVPAGKDGSVVPNDTLTDASDPAGRSESGPGLLESLLPILVPVVLITIGSIIAYLIDSGGIEPSQVTEWLSFVGDKNIAIALGLAFAMALVRYIDPDKRRTLVSRSLASAGNIILITAAGGAFGAMLRQAGIATAVGNLVDANAGLMLLPLAFAVTTAIRTLQGSATVAMITAAGVLQGFATADTLPFHPVYLAMAIGAGSKPVSWMTDSAFWVITRMSGMTEAEGLKVISPMSTAMGLSALLVSSLMAWLVPGV